MLHAAVLGAVRDDSVRLMPIRAPPISAKYSMSGCWVVVRYNRMRGKQEYAGAGEHLISIRRQHRDAQTRQLKNTLRFNLQVAALLDAQHQAEEEEDRQPTPEPEVLEELVEKGEREAVLSAIIDDAEGVRETVEAHMERVLGWMFERLECPQAAVALARLARASAAAAAGVFAGGWLPRVGVQLRRLSLGAPQQNIYLHCLCACLERPELVEEAQLGAVFGAVEEACVHWLREGREHNLSVLAAARLLPFSAPGRCFSREFVCGLLESFWAAQHAINRSQLFACAVQAVRLEPYRLSVSLLVAALRVALHGHARVQPQVAALVQPPALLTAIFAFYNANDERMEPTGVVRVGHELLPVTLHSFLLEYEQALFASPPLDAQYLQFLLEFSLKAPLESTCEVWRETGLLEGLVRVLSEQSPVEALLALRVLLTLLKSNDQLNPTLAGELLRSYLIEHDIAALQANFLAPQLQEALSELLFLLRRGEIG